MPFMSWIHHHRLLVSGFSFAVVLIVAIAGGVWFFLLRSAGTQIDLRQALRLYRQDQHAAAGSGEDLPAPGVYVYKTSGRERLSLAGISRSFPSSEQHGRDRRPLCVDGLGAHRSAHGGHRGLPADERWPGHDASVLDRVNRRCQHRADHPLSRHGLLRPPRPARGPTLVLPCVTDRARSTRFRAR